MPAVTSTTEENIDSEQKMRNTLKRHIVRERQRKKEEYEAEVEEERLRKEREARERQDVMTLEETKEQIEQLEQKLKQLEKEKQQLFMQLKKVLNEDEIRKRQQQKESNEMTTMKMPMSSMPMPMFSIPTSTGQGEPPPTQGRPPPLTSHILNKPKHSSYMLLQQPPLVRGPMQSAVKRPRSPSPTYPLYTAHRLHQPPIKHQSVYSDHKPSQYAQNVGSSSVSSSGAYYTMPNSGHSGQVVVGERPPPLLYAHHSPHPGNLMYAPSQPQAQMYLDMLKNRDAPQQHQEPKKDQQQVRNQSTPQVLIGLSEQHHPAVSVGYAQPTSARHLIHPPQHNNIQQQKPGSITQGYPVQQSNPNVQNPNIYPNRHRY